MLHDLIKGLLVCTNDKRWLITNLALLLEWQSGQTETSLSDPHMYQLFACHHSYNLSRKRLVTLTHPHNSWNWRFTVEKELQSCGDSHMRLPLPLRIGLLLEECVSHIIVVHKLMQYVGQTCEWADSSTSACSWGHMSFELHRMCVRKHRRHDALLLFSSTSSKAGIKHFRSLLIILARERRPSRWNLSRNSFIVAYT